MGDQDARNGYQSLTQFFDVFQSLQILSNLKTAEIRCYKFLQELLCHAYVPRCDPATSEIIPACKETCVEVLEACDWIDLAASGQLHCDYLPANGTVPCFYEPVTCGPPPNTNNAVLLRNNSQVTDTFPVNTTREFVCEDDSLELQGDNVVQCLFSGLWSEPPQCVPPHRESRLLTILVPLLFLVVILLIGVAAAARMARKRQKLAMLVRQKEFDAFVCFNFDDHNDYVCETILPEFEENQNPPFRLLSHERDFVPGSRINTNIAEAIQNTNSAIIVMSRNFVKSEFCKYEFDLCSQEHAIDPAFRLFVIMMDPVEDLEEVPPAMRLHFRQETYLNENDPDKFEKIARYLTWVKQPKENRKRCCCP